MTDPRAHDHGRTGKSRRNLPKGPRGLQTSSGLRTNLPTPGELKRAQEELLRGEEDTAADGPGIPNQRLDSRPFSKGRKVAVGLPRDDKATERTVNQGVDDAGTDDTRTASKTGTKSQG